ncbi:MAG: hypothetical protein ACI9QN_001431, partial [Arcticibacterium sp.]
KTTFSTGFTIAFWLKEDLSSGMDPANGSCSPNGHHILFAKGGDGYGTSPNGIYAKLAPLEAGKTEHLLGSSAGSGGLDYVDTLVNGTDWHFYTYIISTNSFQLYIDGNLTRTSAHNINFTETNAEDLYIGILGPKSTPAQGITNWFPLKGLLDDFNLFDRELSSAEVNILFQGENIALEQAPSINRLDLLGRNYQYFGGRYSYWTYDLFEFSANDKIIMSKPNGPGYNTPYSTHLLQKLTKDSITTTKGFGYSSITTISDPEYGSELSLSNYNLLKNNNLYYSILDWCCTQDSLLILSTNLEVLSRVNLGSNEILKSFILNGKLVLIGNESGNASQGFVKTFNLSGSLLNDFQLNEEIRDIHFDFGYLIIANANKFFHFDNNLSGYVVNSISSNSTKVTKDNLILLQASSVKVFNLNTSGITSLNKTALDCYVASDTSGYFLVINNTFEKYAANNSLQVSFESPINSGTNFSNILQKKGYFIFQSYYPAPYSSTIPNTFYHIYNESGNLIYIKNEFIYPEYASKSYHCSIFDNNDILLGTAHSLSKVSNTGELIWEKEMNNDYRNNISSINSDNSIWLIKTAHNVGQNTLVKINNSQNRCDYAVLNPFASQYCPPINGKLHLVEPTFSGNIAPSYQYCKGGCSWFESYGFGFNLVWKKNGVILTDDYYTSFSGNGDYQFGVIQEGCEVFSPVKTVSYSNLENPAIPIFEIDKPVICDGQTAIITSPNCQYEALKWIDEYLGTYPNHDRRLATPSATTNYFAHCEQTYKLKNYISGVGFEDGAVCQSPIASATVTVIQPSDTETISDPPVSDSEYFSGTISSSQQILDTIKSSYSAIKTIDLTPGFEASKSSVFTAEIENCEE